MTVQFSLFRLLLLISEVPLDLLTHQYLAIKLIDNSLISFIYLFISYVSFEFCYKMLQ